MRMELHIELHQEWSEKMRAIARERDKQNRTSEDVAWLQSQDPKGEGVRTREMRCI